MLIRFYTFFSAIAVAFIYYSCATPVAPTGGPPDRTPPAIEETRPVNETVNFDGREIRLSFSKFINRSSLRNAISIEPDLAIGFEVSWRRKSATIEFDSELPDNTTVIVNIGTELQDTRGNNLDTPYRLAISTGPEIDDGVVTSRVRQANDGRTDSGFRVFLYRDPIDLDGRANYVAQTDTAGYAEFSYLSEGTYKAIWVDDVNRNRIWDRERELAQPFYDSTFTLARGGEVNLGTIYMDKPDTTRPVLQGVGLLTESRLRLRFNEEVYWEDDSVIHVTDTLGNRYTEAWPIYVLPEDPQVLIAQSMDPLSVDEHFEVDLDGFYDRSGNPSRVNVSPFGGSAQPDTVALKIIGDNREPGLFPDEPLIIGYNKFIDDQNVLDSLKVVRAEEMIEEWEHTEIDRHRLYIYPGERWESGITYQFLIWNPFREQLRPIEPMIWQRNQLGSIEITLADTSNTEVHHLTLFDEEEKVRIDTTFTGSIDVDRLPPLTFTAIVFEDQNRSGRWDPGTVIPFQVPEPYYVRRNIPVREGFTSEVEVSFETSGDSAPAPQDQAEPEYAPDPDPGDD